MHTILHTKQSLTHHTRREHSKQERLNNESKNRQELGGFIQTRGLMMIRLCRCHEGRFLGAHMMMTSSMVHVYTTRKPNDNERHGIRTG